MQRNFDDKFLRMLRNDIPIQTLITDILDMPSKYSEGYFRFLCPRCFEFNTSVKKSTNLARCFRCKENFNPIDLVMNINNISFKETVEFLKQYLQKIS